MEASDKKAWKSHISLILCAYSFSQKKHKKKQKAGVHSKLNFWLKFLERLAYHSNSYNKTMEKK